MTASVSALWTRCTPCPQTRALRFRHLSTPKDRAEPTAAATSRPPSLERLRHHVNHGFVLYDRSIVATAESNVGSRPAPASGTLQRLTRSFLHREVASCDPTHLVLIDETGIATDLIRRYGRSVRGARVHDQAPYGRS